MEPTPTDSYFWMFLNYAIAKEDLTAPLGLLILFLARILPIIALAPFFGSRILPHPVKIAFGISLYVIFLPKLLDVTTTVMVVDSGFFVLGLKEVFIGYLIGLLMSIPFTIATSAGVLIDHQRGGSSLMVNDPTVQNQSSPLGTLFNFVLIYIFFRNNGPFLFIDLIMSSYEMVPPDQFFNPMFFNMKTPFATEMLTLLNKVMTISIQLATPALLAILMTDVFLGIINRLAPQVQITFLGMPLKSLLGLLLVTIGWELLMKQMSLTTFYWLDIIKEAIGMFGYGGK